MKRSDSHTQQLILDKLEADGLLSQQNRTLAVKQAVNEKMDVIDFLITKELVTDEQVTKIVAGLAKIPYVDLSDAKIRSQTLDLLPQAIAERYMAVPLGEMNNRLVVAMLDADDVQSVDFLSNRIGRVLKVYLASKTGLRAALRQYEVHVDKDITDVLTSTKDASDVVVSDEDVKTITEDSPISKALSSMLEYAARHRASDIHIEPLEHMLKIRVRIDGVLTEMMSLPKSTEPPLVSRIKILSNLKIDEHRTPQDGQFTISILDKKIDLRIAIAPVVWGEQVVIRLLDKTGTSLRLEDMGYAGRSLTTIREGIKNSNGMILTSGPTGSGKSTSLYALIQEIKSEKINIITLEDPVEYKMDGINQIQVNPQVGLTFASGLRSILRQDPDVVMVGEIRDKETASLAVQAALTGHLVLSTLHTNSAAGILPRLLDMEVEPFLIASTVRTVIGQRLVRRLAKGKESYAGTVPETAAIVDAVGDLLPKTKEETDAVAADLGYSYLPLATEKSYTLFKGVETEDNIGGYKGRMGIYEVFNVSEAIQQLIINHATSAEIERQACSEGMITMRQDGYLKALAGLTSLEEINRVATADSA